MDVKSAYYIVAVHSEDYVLEWKGLCRCSSATWLEISPIADAIGCIAKGQGVRELWQYLND